MKKEDCIRVVFLAQELQEDHEDGFRLTGWVNAEGEIAAAEYEDYITAWQEDDLYVTSGVQHWRKARMLMR